MAAVAVVIAAAAGGTWWWTIRAASEKPEYQLTRVERGNITAAVAASGTINPVASVAVSSQISGQLKEVLADYNSVVRQGDVIARIDSDTFLQRVNQARADLDAAGSQVLVQESLVNQRKAEISRAEVTLAESRRDLARKDELLAKNFIAVAERDRIAAQVRIQEEDVKTARAGLLIAQAQLGSAGAAVKQRQAALAGAKIDLERTVIRSPVDGIVIRRAVDAGEMVAASLQAPLMFMIARNLSDMQVETSIDESDISRIRLDQKASFTVDAFPGRSFEGTVTQVRKSAQSVANVVTYIVIVTFSNADGALQPGMTANVRIVTEIRRDVLKIANGALRFRPPGEASASAVGAGGGKSGGGAAVGGDDGKAVAAGGAPRPATAGPGGKSDAGQPTVASQSGATGGGGGQLGAIRRRLDEVLVPTPEQSRKLDAIFAAAREKFIGLRAVAEEERAKLVSVYRAEMREMITDILDSGQKSRYAALLQEAAGRSGTAASGRVFVLDNGRPRALAVRTGISDGNATEVSGAGLAEGAEVIIAAVAKSGTVRPAGAGLPRLF